MLKKILGALSRSKPAPAPVFSPMKGDEATSEEQTYVCYDLARTPWDVTYSVRFIIDDPVLLTRYFDDGNEALNTCNIYVQAAMRLKIAIYTGDLSKGVPVALFEGIAAEANTQLSKYGVRLETIRVIGFTRAQ